MAGGHLHPKIGVISDCPLQRHVLKKALNNYGLQIALSCGPELLDAQADTKIQQVSCWILVLENEEFSSPALDALIEQTETPVLFGLGKAPNKYDELYISWERRLFSKISELIGQVDIFESADSVLSLEQDANAQMSQHSASQTKTPSVFLSQQQKSDLPTDVLPRQPASEIWILAASLGGPAAVKAFLDKIPRTIRASFLYAQHIDAHFSTILTQVLGRHSKLDLLALENSYPLYDGEVRMIPVDHEVKFDGEHVRFTENKWQGLYGPSIDHLLKNALAVYGAKCHLIVFSGMGNDSAMMAPIMRKAGCQIWTQNPESCASSSMPQAIIDLKCSHFCAEPEVLANALITRVGCHDYSDDIQTNHEDLKGV